MAKLVKGRKRHIVTDTEVFLLAMLGQVEDHHASVPLLRSSLILPKLRRVFADRGPNSSIHMPIAYFESAPQTQPDVTMRSTVHISAAPNTTRR